MTQREGGVPAWRLIVATAGACVAIIIGSGFSTGQEALQYFAVHGVAGYAGLALAAVLLGYTTVSLLLAGRRYDLPTNEAAFKHFCGPWLGVVLAWYTMVLILAVCSVLVAGAGAVLSQTFGLPVLVGASLMAIAAVVTLLLGLTRLVEAVGLIGPLIAVMMIVVGLAALLDPAADVAAGAQAASELPILRAADSWWFAGLLYVGLIAPGFASFLPALGRTVASDSIARASGWLSAALFAVAMGFAATALLGNLQEIHSAQVPTLILASKLVPGADAVLAVVIFLAVFSTITPLLWSICKRFSEEDTPRYRVLAVGLGLLGWLGGTVLPFGTLLNWIYPTVGYMGILFLICQVVRDLREYLGGRIEVNARP